MLVRGRTLARMMSTLVSCVTTVLMGTTIVYLGVEEVRDVVGGVNVAVQVHRDVPVVGLAGAGAVGVAGGTRRRASCSVSVAQGVVFCGQLLASLKCGVLGVVETGAHVEGDVHGV